MNRRFLSGLGLACVVMASIGRPSRASTPASHPRVVTSGQGRTWLKLVPTPGGAATATLTTFGDDGEDKVLWKKKLVNDPRQVLIFDAGDPYLVTIDNWASAGGAHGVVIYDPRGEVVADLNAREVFPELLDRLARPQTSHNEAQTPTVPAVPYQMDGGIPWLNNATTRLGLDGETPTLIMTFCDESPMFVTIQAPKGEFSGKLTTQGLRVFVSLKDGKVRKIFNK